MHARPLGAAYEFKSSLGHEAPAAVRHQVGDFAEAPKSAPNFAEASEPKAPSKRKPSRSVGRSSSPTFTASSESEGRPTEREMASKTAELKVRLQKLRAKLNHEKAPGFLEVFCGCAEMARNFSKAGFEAAGIDWRGNKDIPRHKCIWMDVHREQIMEALVQNRIYHIWGGNLSPR